MDTTKLASKAIDNALPLLLGAAVVVGVLYFLARKTVSDVASGVGGAVSGDNALTKGTPYAGMGIAGTLGAGVNRALGGLPEKFGGSIASWFSPSTAPTGNLYYNVGFPDGTRHAIVDSDVDRNGYFTYKGVRYRLALTADRTRIAVRV